MINALIVGLGGWGRHLVQSVQGVSDRMRFVAGVTPRVDALRDFADANGLALSADYGAALRRADVDAVVIATPHSLHADQIKEAARQGKHVFVEKPLTLTVKDAIDAANACATAGVGLFVGFNWRFSPAAVALKNLIADGVIGQILHLEGNYSGPSGLKRRPGTWRLDPQENPAGAMTGRGVHVLNLMNMFAGHVTRVCAHNDRHIAPVIEDTTSVLLRFGSGASGYVGSLQATAEYWRLQAFGSKGWAEMCSTTQLTTCLIGEEPRSTQFDDVVMEVGELEAFADCIASGTFPRQALDDAIHAVALLQAIHASAASGSPRDVEDLSALRRDQTTPPS